MSVTYFKPRDRFDFSKDTLDIGNPLQWDRKHFLKHLFKRAFAISEDRIEEFYQRHLDYYLEKHSDGSEEIFFKYLWGLIERQLKVLMGKNIYDKDHIENERQIKQLQKFTEMLISVDRWNVHKSNDTVIAQQEFEIIALKQQVADLEAELKENRVWETDGYIIIRDGQALAVLDLCLQMQKLKATDGKELLITPAQNAWAKMISKYFREIDEENKGQAKEIKIDRLRYYLRGLDPKDPLKRENEIPEKHKLYTIAPVKKRK
ncbi:hypothetical protein SAMN05216464_1243 [Mucilaginibacter pineti]|uniref:Uncharacterized protein n=1 Tax=Mucilaginibacter pineti TaxID=1391627 RepID=A0A1G7MZM0_9SPHI|nr:hypothetical protein [Mucilaginibacter pineti]SDF67224.1 hypothetical protein SAMN05216464_1243 [Mucilaginibacter pineti]